MTKPQDPARKALNAYVRHRLTEETKAHGAQSELARAIKFSHVHVGNVIRDKSRGIGDMMARALAKRWRMTLAQLEETAVAWSRTMSTATNTSTPIAPPDAVAWGKSPTWERELKLAKSIGSSAVPPRFYDDLAAIVLSSREPTAARIARFAEALFLSE